MWPGASGIRSRRVYDPIWLSMIGRSSSDIRAALFCCSALLSALIFAEHLHYKVMNARAQLPNCLIVAVRMNPVGQQGDNNFPFRLDPDRGAGKSHVSNRRGREMTARAGIFR